MRLRGLLWKHIVTLALQFQVERKGERLAIFFLLSFWVLPEVRLLWRNLRHLDLDLDFRLSFDLEVDLGRDLDLNLGFDCEITRLTF